MSGHFSLAGRGTRGLHGLYAATQDDQPEIVRPEKRFILAGGFEVSSEDSCFPCRPTFAGIRSSEQGTGGYWGKPFR